jgi:hypothetical protein
MIQSLEPLGTLIAVQRFADTWGTDPQTAFERVREAEARVREMRLAQPEFLDAVKALDDDFQILGDALMAQAELVDVPPALRHEFTSALRDTAMMLRRRATAAGPLAKDLHTWADTMGRRADCVCWPAGPLGADQE